MNYPLGILVTSGTVLHNAGPGGAILAYALTGTVAWSVIASLGEMTALMPVKAPIVEFASRYVDSAVGFVTGWMYWFVGCCCFPWADMGKNGLYVFFPFLS